VILLASYQIINTFADFQHFWEKNRDKTVEDQIDNWSIEYMDKWPELKNMQIRDYEKSGNNWRDIAKKYVFYNLNERINTIKLAQENLIQIIPSIFDWSKQRLDLDFDIVFIIYVGIGLGAGWATKYQGNSAVLLGLENIAEENWENKESLKGLLAHEIGHLFHFNLRRKNNLENEYPSPLWPLYEEGFAMRCEHKIMNEETWHQQIGLKNWLKWCVDNKEKLASKYLEFIEKKMKVNDFFGSWFNIDGYKQTGYYLGHEIIKEWEESDKFENLAIMSIQEVENRVHNSLTKWKNTSKC
jgi:hypothetical protein